VGGFHQTIQMMLLDIFLIISDTLELPNNAMEKYHMIALNLMTITNLRSMN